MGDRRLSSDEQALWVALTRTVRPIGRAPAAVRPEASTAAAGASGGERLTLPPPWTAPPKAARTPAAVLDSGWERRIRAGALVPDMAIDLHGHSLSAAHVRLNQAIAAALMRDARVLLVVTGKLRKSEGEAGLSRRGAIRAEIGHWLQTSPHADRIASVRVAHPRHGGDGALYIILRRKK